jgi:hypothetical protein
MACGHERPHIAEVPKHVPGPNPFIGNKLYVDPNMHSVKQAAAWRAQRPDDAALMDKIASQPQAEWLGEWSGAVKLFVRQKMKQYAEIDAMGLFIVYNVPDRDCGQHSKGGAKNADAYLEWVNKVADGVDDGKAVMILEPDALSLLSKCTVKAKHAERYKLLADAIRIFKSRPHIHVYLDAGNARWLAPEEIAEHLNAAGLEYADGRVRQESLGVDQRRPFRDRHGAQRQRRRAGQRMVQPGRPRARHSTDDRHRRAAVRCFPVAEAARRIGRRLQRRPPRRRVVGIASARHGETLEVLGAVQGILGTPVKGARSAIAPCLPLPSVPHRPHPTPRPRYQLI